MIRQLLFPLSSLVFFSCLTATGQGGGVDEQVEQSVCGLQEPVMFWLWSGVAGRPNPARLATLTNVEDIAFETRDGRRLRGYRLKARDSEGQDVSPRGYLLVMQGNAMLADRILGEFVPFASTGLDVYIYDYRGYGRSGGKRRLKAIASDYTEILAALNAGEYEQRFVYAMSFGGIALLVGAVSHDTLDRVVIDSTPSRLSGYGCPPAYDPVKHLPVDCHRFLLIAGGADRVVTPAMSRELVETAQRRGAEVYRDEVFGHPFMDPDRSVHRRRMDIIQKYLK